MKKRILCYFVAVLLLVSSAPVVNAAKSDSYSSPIEIVSVYNPVTGDYEEIIAASITVLPDGSKIIISEPFQDTTVKTSGGVTSSKYCSKVDDNNVLLWRITLTASFTFNGTSATCTAANSVTTVYQGNWSESSNNTYPSGNTAVADVTVVRKVLFIIVETQNVFLTLTCDGNGHLT